MGLFGKIAGGLADVATSIIPGPIDDKIVDVGKRLIGNIRGSGSSSRRSRRRGRVPRGSQTGTSLVPSRGDDQPGIGPFRTSPVDFGPVEFDPGRMFQGGDDGNGNGSQQMMQGGGGFVNDMAMKLIFQTMGDSSTGRALVEAMTSGSLQNGIIQPTVTVNTPRGSENHSPPGFRTVYVNDQPYAVFKPFAKSLGLLKNESGLTFRQKLDKQTRQYQKNRRFIKDVAKKVGLKTSNRKSGPTR